MVATWSCAIEQVRGSCSERPPHGSVRRTRMRFTSICGGRERTFCGTEAPTATPTARPWPKPSPVLLATTQSSLTGTIRCPGSADSFMVPGCGLLGCPQLPQAPMGRLGREVTLMFGEHSTGGPSLLEQMHLLCWTKYKDSSERQCCGGVWLPEIGR